MTPDPADPLDPLGPVDPVDPGMSSKSAESDGVLFKNTFGTPQKWVPKSVFSENFKYLHKKLDFRENTHKFKKETISMTEKKAPAGMMSPKEGLG
jgi:hypothetical protein